MATLYNKTALNKIKKADLIQMFLEQQAKLNDSHLATDVADHDNKLYDVIRNLKAENEKLKDDIAYLKHQKSIQTDKLKEFMDEINKLNKETKMWENPADY